MRIRLRLGRRRNNKQKDIQRMLIIAGCLCLLLYSVSRLLLYALDAKRSASERQVFQTLYFSEAEKQAEQEALAERSSILRQFEVTFSQQKTAEKAPAQSSVSRISNWPDNPSMTVSAALRKLRQQNGDIIGWLSIPETLEQAVVQRDNTYYLKRDYRGYHNANGALFLEEGISLKTRPDTYIIFGHNMKTGDMFGSLRLYEDVGYYRRHAVIDFNSLYEDGQYAVFAIADVDTVQGMKHYAPFMQLPGMEEKARADCIQKLQAYSLLYSPIPVSADDQLLLLVTCEGAEESRRIVAARRLREGETEQTLSSLLPYARKR